MPTALMTPISSSILFATTFEALIGFVKFGQPVPLLNLSDDAKSGSPDTAST
jgi:hypothetical protein